MDKLQSVLGDGYFPRKSVLFDTWFHRVMKIQFKIYVCLGVCVCGVSITSSRSFLVVETERKKFTNEEKNDALQAFDMRQTCFFSASSQQISISMS